MQIDTPLTCKKYVLDNYHYQNTIFPLAFQGVLFYFPSNTPKSGCLSLAGSDENSVFLVLQNRKIPPILSSKEKSRLFRRLFRFLVQEFSKNLAPLSGLVRPPVRAGRHQPQRPNRIARTPAQGGRQEHALSACPPVQDGPRAGIRQRGRRASGAPRLVSTNRRAGAQGEAARAQPSAAGGQRVGRHARVGCAPAARGGHSLARIP